MLRVGDRELAGRRDVEEVEGERAGDGADDADPQAPHRRDEQDAGEVDDAQRNGRRALLERIDESGCRRDCQQGDQQARSPRAPAALVARQH
jgi:hypothetical protein